MVAGREPISAVPEVNFVLRDPLSAIRPFLVIS